MPALSVVVPYADVSLDRARALAYVVNRHREEGRDTVIGRGDPDQWRKGAAIRDALARTDADLLVVSDADVWCDELPQAIEAVASGAVHWAVPYWHVERLTQDATARFVAGERDGLVVAESHFGVAGGGIVVLARDVYERIPVDERFVGWGGEDQAWSYALRTLAGRAYRNQAGVLWHLWHEPQKRKTRAIGSDENEALRAEYAGANQQPRKMRELIAEGRQWASSVSSLTL